MVDIVLFKVKIIGASCAFEAKVYYLMYGETKIISIQRKSFVVVFLEILFVCNCASIPMDNFWGKRFGYKKGAIDRKLFHLAAA